MRLIDADALKDNFKNVDANGINLELDRYALKCIDNAPTIDAIPVDWLVQRVNETSGGSGVNVELISALFAVGVEWERWKKEHEVDE